MTLDVVVPTYNRSSLLRKTITSLLKAPIPAGLEVTIFIADNNSPDDTESVVRELKGQTMRNLQYVKETRQSSSYARNAGIAAGSGEIIAFVDDDEEVGEQWFSVIAREFGNPGTQYIGGPCLPNAAVAMPDWLPPGYNGVIGVIRSKGRAPYGPAFPGNLNSGNAALRRTVFDVVGLYSTKLGRSGKGLLSEEDADLYRRIMDAGLHGIHVPDFIIYHYIPTDRLTRKYHRRWCYWRGVSQGVADKTCKEPVAYMLGVPRYRMGQALSGLAALPKRLITKQEPGPTFARELAIWGLLGFVHGKYLIRIDRYYTQ